MDECRKLFDSLMTGRTVRITGDHWDLPVEGVVMCLSTIHKSVGGCLADRLILVDVGGWTGDNGEQSLELNPNEIEVEEIN